jgi:hypothetical protein
MGYLTIFNLGKKGFILPIYSLQEDCSFLLMHCRIQVLNLDDFLITHLGNDRSLVLLSLIKNRDELGTSTIITSQYDPRTGISFLVSDGNFAMGDSIRRCLLNNGYTLLIEKAV